MADPTQTQKRQPPRPSFSFFAHAGLSPSTLPTHNAIPLRRTRPELCVAQLVAREGHAVLRDATHEIACEFAGPAHAVLTRRDRAGEYSGNACEVAGLGCIVVLLDYCLIPLTGFKFEVPSLDLFIFIQNILNIIYKQGHSGIETPSSYVEISRALILSDPVQEQEKRDKENGKESRKEKSKPPMSVADLAVLLSKGPYNQPVSVRGYLQNNY